MSYPPPYGPPPPAYGQPGWQPPPNPYPYPPPDYGQVTQPQPPMPIYVPGTVMVPVPVVPPPMPQMPQPESSQPTYVTNYIYHGQTSGSQVQISESAGDFDWVPSTSTTASHLTGRAVVGGKEGWDGSPLWVIRSWHNSDLIPGKLAVRHNHASVMFNGKEIPVQNIEVLCARPDTLRWVPSSNGNVPPGAIVGGKTSTGETLYVGRARHQLSVTPGKVHPTHKTCYIGFGGAEIAYNQYDVLCRLR